MKKIFVLLLLLIAPAFCLLFAACQFHTNLPKTDQNAAFMVTDYHGVYQGTLPCADCPGIKTTLTLNPDNTFVYKTCYLEEKDGTFSSKGIYTIKEDLLTIEENGHPIHFLMEGNELHMLDANLKPATGELASRYTLKKQK